CPRAFERYSEACAVLADNTAGYAKRTARTGRGVGDRHDPGWAVGLQGRHPRSRQLDAHDLRTAACALKWCFTYGISVVFLERGKVNRSGAVEDQPQRIGAVKDRCWRGRGKRKFNAKCVAGLIYTGNDGRFWVSGWPRGFDRLYDFWRAWRRNSRVGGPPLRRLRR